MSGFSPEWLALREPVDHRSRNRELAARLNAQLCGRPSVRVVDLGCGTGSNIRATSALLGREQSWTLVDYDARLLDAARRALLAWADRVVSASDTLELEKDARRLTIGFRQVDLNSELDAALGKSVDLVTASAFFDLCSPAFIQRIAAATAARRAAFYTVLTYDGVQTWEPPHPADVAMRAAFHRHQTIDKGFGGAAGPGAPSSLALAFAAHGYTVEDAGSPWRLGASDARLLTDLASGFADAVAETGDVAVGVIANWRGIARIGAVVGHTDTLAVPAA
jgi:SAM-dependent methyltransferase